MVILDSSRRGQRVPRLAAWSLGVAVVATIGANLAHGLGHGPVGALVSAWPALALVGSYELLMMLIRTEHQTAGSHDPAKAASHAVPATEQAVPPTALQAPTMEQTVRAWHNAGRSQRAIARELSIDRRKVKQIIDQAASKREFLPTMIIENEAGSSCPTETSQELRCQAARSD
jgi:hypothetical protein